MAAHAGHLEVVTALLGTGASINERDAWGRTPLHWAAYADRLETVEYLLKKGADPAIGDGSGETALQLAERSSNGRRVATFLRMQPRPSANPG
jgi:ankyrin repeat protein